MSNTRIIGDLVATTEIYKDKEGKERRKFLKVGTAFVTDTDGGQRLSIKMDAMPLSAEWNRWLSVYPRKDRRADEEAEYNRQQVSNESSQDDIANIGEPVDLSDIPF